MSTPFSASPISRRLFLTQLGCGSLAVAGSREDRSFPDWPASKVDQILTDSPWAKEATVSFDLRGATRSGNSSVRTEIFLTIRWASSLPVRQASALLAFGAAGLGEEKAVELLQSNEAEYVVEVAGFPASLVNYITKDLEADLLRSAKLLVSGRTPVVASSVQVPEHGMHRMAILRFPRLRDLDPGENTIEFRAASGPLHLHQRFKLKEMLYAGRLEL